ncbi:MAG: 30S ribosomal protein S18 [Treponema sp.]|nr:30S ribosomal protein S18 [Treponema sp.]
MANENTEIEAKEAASTNEQLQEQGREDEGRTARKGKAFFHKKVCRFCANKAKIDYKDADGLRRFTTERGKILPRRITGTCAKHQKELSTAIKRARSICLLPFVAD